MSNWYALFVAPRKEQVVEILLRQRQFETFSPSILEHRRWSDRIKKVESLLFPGYVFCRFDPTRDRKPVVTVPGVQWVVGHGRDPVAVPEPEIAALQQAMEAGARIAPHEYLHTGDRVRIMRGAMAGVTGILTTVKNATRVVLSVELLRRSVAVEVDREDIQPLEDRRWEAIRAGLSRTTFAGGIQ